MRQPCLAFNRQVYGPGAPVKQRRPEQLFQMADPLADRRLRQSGLGCCRRETAATGGGLERAYPLQRWHFEWVFRH